MVSRALRSLDGVAELLVHTGQHYDSDMSDVFFEELEIPRPDYNLGVGSGPHGQQTGRMLEAIEAVLVKEKPQAVIVYGDTNSTVAGALGAVKLHIPVAHVEAGLRSFNRTMPEELNRVVADHLATLCLAPTRLAVDNLAREGIAGGAVQLVGDVMYDCSLHYADRAAGRIGILSRLGVRPREYVLATVHRAENTDSRPRMGAICLGLAGVAANTPVLFPAHPRTRAVIEAQGWLRTASPGLQVIEPVGYLDMVCLEKNAALIVTDSGGVQKEAFFHRVPCVTLRDETEWVELVAIGANRLSPPTSADRVAQSIHAALAVGFPAQPSTSLYGDGNAAGQVAAAVCDLASSGRNDRSRA